MHEPTDRPAPPEAGGQPNPIPTPMQQAHTAYSSHATTCSRCRDVDRDRCGDGQRLWRAWEGACDDAYRQLAEQAL